MPMALLPLWHRGELPPPFKHPLVSKNEDLGTLPKKVLTLKKSRALENDTKALEGKTGNAVAYTITQLDPSFSPAPPLIVTSTSNPNLPWATMAALLTAPGPEPQAAQAAGKRKSLYWPNYIKLSLPNHNWNHLFGSENTLLPTSENPREELRRACLCNTFLLITFPVMDSLSHSLASFLGGRTSVPSSSKPAITDALDMTPLSTTVIFQSPSISQNKSDPSSGVLPGSVNLPSSGSIASVPVSTSWHAQQVQGPKATLQHPSGSGATQQPTFRDPGRQ
ncbi:nuclear pore-associated protein 1-like [Marmota monax]|uniref:nuclear pore-associated protein 1-like n=1 Tax=Marmota monax TaxID=9995 RepID=UPI0026EDCA0D|nr:nuclear pore-associated protein 1-like [Marmota monax]